MIVQRLGKLWDIKAVQILFVLVTYLVFAEQLPLMIHRGLLAMSVTIKDLLMWIMPITVCVFIAHTICTFERKAPLFILAIILFETFSNWSSVWYAYGCGNLVADYLPETLVQNTSIDFTPLWRLPFKQPQWWSVQKGVWLGLILGCLSAFHVSIRLRHTLQISKAFVEFMLTRIFSRLVPLFVLGFVVQIYQKQLISHLVHYYGLLAGALVIFLVVYLLGLFTLSAGFSFKTLVRHIKNLLPAGGISLMSSCSLSTMPWTIRCTQKNLQRPELAQAIIPAITNIQQIGDCVANTFLCFLIYHQYFGHDPDLVTWIEFSTMFILARFATAAIMGGAIFLMLPIYENFLSFNAEMIAVILAFNVILDPIITSSNVIANGALCRVFERVWNRIQGLSPEKSVNMNTKRVTPTP